MATLADYNNFVREQGVKPQWMRHIGDGFIYPVTSTNYLYPHLELVTEEQAFPEKFASATVKKRSAKPKVDLQTDEVPERKAPIEIREEATAKAAKNPAVKRNRNLGK